jgi:uncharacterized damage-inducible protein DinB
MTNREFCIARRKAELPASVRVLKALPQGKLDYRPDPKGRTAAELAWMLACSEAALVSLLNTGIIEWTSAPPPAKVEEIVAAFERDSEAANKRLEGLDDAAWQKKGKFLMGGEVVWEDTTELMTWGFLFDSIHHRGQLSTYLRPMGGKVPSIYGPSADDTGQ